MPTRDMSVADISTGMDMSANCIIAGWSDSAVFHAEHEAE
jgi:hypothetical protein